MIAANVTPSDFRLYMTLLSMADSDSPTAEIPARFQPRSIIRLAEKCHLSEAAAKRSLNHLQRHGWIERVRQFVGNGIGGRGNRTMYVLCLGHDCDCKAAQREPVSAPDKGAQPEPVTRKKGAQADSINRLTAPRVSAGQAPRCAEGGREGGEIEGGWPEVKRCTVCHGPMDPVLTSCGYTAHPNCGGQADEDHGTAPLAFQPELAA